MATWFGSGFPAARLLTSVLCAAMAGGPVLAQSPQSGRTPPAAGELDVVQVRENVYMIAGAGGNVAVQVGPAGVILVDAGAAGQSDTVLAAVKRLSSRPIR